MMIEFEDHGAEEQRLLLRYLEQRKAQGSFPPQPPAPRPNWLWRLVGCIWLTWARRRYGPK